jgi:hypothetical protein
MKNALRFWNRMMDWSPTDEQIDCVVRAGRICERLLRSAVILAVIYISTEVASAFFPGGPAWQYLKGGQ